MTTSPSPAVSSRTLWIDLTFAYVYVVWGGTFFAVHLALASFPPFLLAGGRFFSSGLILMVLLKIIHPRQFAWGTWPEWKDAAVIGILLLATGNGAVNWAQQYVTTSVAALLFGTVPIWIILIDWLRPRGNVPNARAGWGVVIGFAGILMLMAPGAATHPSGPTWGKVVLVLAGVSWALGAIYSRHSVVLGSPFLPMSRQMIVGGAVLLLSSAVHGDLFYFHLGAVTTLAWGAFLYLVLCGSVTGFTAYIWLMRVSTTERTATIQYVNLAIAVLLGCTLGREPLGWRMILGAATIVGAVVLVMQKRKGALSLSD